MTKTGKLIEMQSGGRSTDKSLEDSRLNTLKENALRAGYKEEDIEVKWVSQSEWHAIVEDDRKTIPITEETLIAKKIRELAIAELIKEGTLESDGKLPKPK
jgi:hypothetical protein